MKSLFIAAAAAVGAIPLLYATGGLAFMGLGLAVQVKRLREYRRRRFGQREAAPGIGLGVLAHRAELVHGENPAMLSDAFLVPLVDGRSVRTTANPNVAELSGDEEAIDRREEPVVVGQADGLEGVRCHEHDQLVHMCSDFTDR